jgi:protoporphyrinogen/coproporphyrinogen III oxidase
LAVSAAIASGAAAGVVVIGGGIAGLAAAHRLKQQDPALAVTLVEAEKRLGGKIVTERVDGFVLEGGPDVFLARKPRGVDLCRELGIEDRLRGTNLQQRRTYVLRDGRLLELPEGLAGLLPTRAGPLMRSPLLSPWAKLRLALEYFVPPRRDGADETLASFVSRRLGPEMYDRLVEPLLSGIYAGDGRELSLAATFPQLRRHEAGHGGLIRAMLAAQRDTQPAAPDAGQARSAFLAPAGGMGELVDALERRLLAAGLDIRLGQAVVSVERDGAAWHVQLAAGQSIAAQAVIVTAPARRAASLLEALDASLAAGLRSIPHASTATISLAYRRKDVPHLLDGYGYLIPRAEGRPALACTWVSTKHHGRAPDGYALLRVFAGRAGQEQVLEQDDEGLARLAREELRRTLGIEAAPVLQRVYRWQEGMPQYTLGHLARVAGIERGVAAHPGLALAGNAYHGVGIPDCIASGEAAAEQALAAIAPQQETLKL